MRRRKMERKHREKKAQFHRSVRIARVAVAPLVFKGARENSVTEMFLSGAAINTVRDGVDVDENKLEEDGSVRSPAIITVVVLLIIPAS